MELKRPNLRLTALAFLGVIAACADAGPDQIEGGSTVYGNENVNAEAAEEDKRPQGTAFADAGTVADLEGDLENGQPLNLATPGDGGAGLADQNPGLAPYLNPNLAAGLRADPGTTAKGKIDGLVTFGDLSLVGVNLDHLLDYIYKPESDGADAFEFPAKVQEKAGKDRAVIGYMIPLEMKPRSDEIISFMLVRDLAACCFGGVPRPDEWIHVEMPEGKTTELFRYVPITVRGEFVVGRLEDEYGYAMGVYNIKAESVELYDPETK